MKGCICEDVTRYDVRRIYAGCEVFADLGCGEMGRCKRRREIVYDVFTVFEKGSVRFDEGAVLWKVFSWLGGGEMIRC